MVKPESPQGPAAGQLLVLLVDDYDDTREIYALHLTRTGYRVEEASNGHAAFDKATRLRPDVILMDLGLPGVDGWELARRLKSAELTAHVPIIAMTARVRDDDRARARAVGCDALVIMPCLPDVLAREVARVLGSLSHGSDA